MRKGFAFLFILLGLTVFSISSHAHDGDWESGPISSFQEELLAHPTVRAAEKQAFQQGFARTNQPMKIQWNGDRFLAIIRYMNYTNWATRGLYVHGQLTDVLLIESAEVINDQPRKIPPTW